jgi:hypothetical protein
MVISHGTGAGLYDNRGANASPSIVTFTPSVRIVLSTATTIQCAETVSVLGGTSPSGQIFYNVYLYQVV